MTDSKLSLLQELVSVAIYEVPENSRGRLRTVQRLPPKVLFLFRRASFAPSSLSSVWPTARNSAIAPAQINIQSDLVGLLLIF